MSDFPSINNLLHSDDDKQTADEQRQGATSKFKVKMHDLDLQQKEKIVQQQAVKLGIPHIDLSKFPVSHEALKVIDESLAKEKNLVCFFYNSEEVRIGCVNYDQPTQDFIEQLGAKYNAHVGVYLISEHSFEKVFELYKNMPKIKPVSKDIDISDEKLASFESQINDFRNLSESFSKVSTTDFMTLLIAAALKVKASDIHVEAEAEGIAVRYRIDGVLQDIANLPKELWKKFISRIKLLAALKINVIDKPQDGRVTLNLGEHDLDVRVSSMPTVYGESVVMRILYSGDDQVTFDDLGLRGNAYEVLRREIDRPNGMIITTGPTGSGKTTTMYSILRLLNKPGVKIITLEDPVEIKMEGVNQSQVDKDKGYTFAKGLKSILRQDPDICMVGEIRDLETAEIAIQAALTGHLILSTIHTNSASGAIPRFLSMGVKPFLLAPALNSVIGQRLVRRICPHCVQEDKLDNERLQKITEILSKLNDTEKNKINLDDLHFYKGQGCNQCSGLGYKGRIGIYEIFIMNKEIEENILSGQVSEYVIEDLAVKSGMVTMAQDGLLKALDKLTSVEEIFRVTE